VPEGPRHCILKDVRLILVRHGETEYNRQGLALGRSDIPLNRRGEEQARRLGKVLAREPLQAVYSSPLRRCMDTAWEIARPHGLTVHPLPALLEMDIGEAEGLPYSQVRERYPGLIEKWLSSDPSLVTMPGGEGLVAVQERAWEAITRLASRHVGETIVVVTHNFVILSILTKALGMPLSSFRRLRHEVAAISVLEIEESKVTLVRLNDTCHLKDLTEG